MSEENNNNTLSDQDQKRIASCFVKTSEYYNGTLPYSCKECDDFDVCLVLQENEVTKSQEGGGECLESKSRSDSRKKPKAS